ncbi:MAG: penicillin-binding transpeptidase domain-containing protein [Chromatiaceae bacterium]|nr:penicillin-binding transpeptidase domain-containing protein [Chromatiaceae bacterium]
MNLLNALVESAAWPTLRAGLHVGFFLVLLYFLKRLFDLRGATGLKHLPRAKRSLALPLVLLVGVLGSVLAYQATWQLTGLFRPQFVAFMQSHDRRQFNPAHRIQRGRILDHRGEVLAASVDHRGQVVRVYPSGPAFAHVVGYSHPRFGAAGIEALANVHLNGGAPEDLKDWGELGRQLVTQAKQPRGRDLMLTVDGELQRLAVDLLGPRPGAVVLLRPSDGAIRVLASTPAYDPNRISAALFRGADPALPLLNRATQGLYPPGSTYKVITAAQALNAGFSGTLYCPADGYTTSARYRKIRDQAYYSAREAGRSWGGYGNLDLATALAESSNVFFAQLGVQHGHDAFRRTAEQLQIGRKISLYEGPFGSWAMATGRVPSIHDSDRYGLAQISIGQGAILVTPAHMALITAAVANRGVAMRPRLVASDPPQALARFLPEGSANRLAKMMRKVVTDGTGRGIDVPGLAIAGKTGTAQNPQGPAHSWFIGFAPAERPALAVAVLVEHAGFGSKAAAPIARDLFLRARELGELP